MDLRLVTAFRAVATSGTVSAAAASLMISQPALSRQLHQLERQLGVALFSRVGRRLKLTSAGRQFFEATTPVMSAVGGAESLAASLAAGRLMTVRMAAPSTTLSDVLAPFLAELKPFDPLINVEEAGYAGAVAAIGSDLDLAIITAPPPRGLASLIVAELPVWAYVPQDDPAADAGEIALPDLASRQLLVLDAAARPRRLLEDALVGSAVTHGPFIECRNSQVAQALAAAGRGVAVVSDDPRFGLVPLEIRIPGGLLTLTLHAAWEPRHHAAHELERLVRQLQSFCSKRYGPFSQRSRAPS